MLQNLQLVPKHHVMILFLATVLSLKAASHAALETGKEAIVESMLLAPLFASRSAFSFPT